MATNTEITTLPEQFRGALSRLELKEKRKRVESAHEEIRELLEGDEKLCEWGVATILIGSYARYTAIFPPAEVQWEIYKPYNLETAILLQRRYPALQLDLPSTGEGVWCDARPSRRRKDENWILAHARPTVRTGWTR